MDKGSVCFLYDYDRCTGETGLQAVLIKINNLGYDLISVTQYKNTYTVFFRRSVNG